VTRIYFLVFTLGLLIGAWLDHYVQPRAVKPLDVSVDCTPTTGV
jgi:hypothetical protein